MLKTEGSGIEGVSPEATLYAFKVLDAQGNGAEEDVIAAIEQCADPNMDGNPEDRLQVVNMSIGADIGSPDDAVSVAVDNATALGITFCVSAGNRGGYANQIDGGRETGLLQSLGPTQGAAQSGSRQTQPHDARIVPAQ